MKNKVINLYNKPQITIPNAGVKYSELLEKFLDPFLEDFKKNEFYEDMIEFAMYAWNTANITILATKSDFGEIDTLKFNDIDVVLLKKMMAFKISNFQEYTNFIVDFDLKDTKSGNPILQVTTQEQDAYLQSMFEQIDEENEPHNFEENYIDRNAIIIKSQQPFIDWLTALYPEDKNYLHQTRTYLISEDNDDINKWLAKKFDKIFTFELDSWCTDKKKWPQKRNYKMFKEWFQIDISDLIFDFEKRPIQKL